MVRNFARMARQDGQHPVVMLIQTGHAAALDVLQAVRPTLAAEDIPNFATAEHADPRDPSLFVGDGRYRSEIDRLFAERFVSLVASLR